MNDFDPIKEVERLKAQTRTIRKRNYSRRKSALDKYKGELIGLHRAGASHAELHRWLRKEKRVRVAHSTVYRYILKNG